MAPPTSRTLSLRWDLARDFAAQSGVLLRGPNDRLPWGRSDSFESDATRDFSGLWQQQPTFALCPIDLDQAQAALRFLYDADIPFALRGAGHCPSGEVLSNGGAVVDLRGLSAVLPAPSTDEARVQGGLFWLPLCRALAASGRAPRVLTDNPHTSVAGTLSIGGFGDSSHRFGLQIDCVRRATLILPTGDRQTVESDDPLLRYALAGHGQLGILADLVLPLWRRPWDLHARVLHFQDADSFVATSIRIAESGRFDYVRARAHGMPPHAISAVVGTYGAERSPHALADLSHCAASDPEWIDFLAHWQQQGVPTWPRYNPALEVVLPLPSGLGLLRDLDGLAQQIGPQRLPRGYSVLVLRGRGASLLPLAPLPESPWALIVALRPECQHIDEAQHIQARFLALLPRIADAGAAIYLASFPLPAEFVERQLGAERAPLLDLKRRVDPKGLCNRGALFGYSLT